MFDEHSELIVLKDDLWLERQKKAGKAVSACLRTFADQCKNPYMLGQLSLKYIEEFCIEIIEEAGCTPTFQGYDGFPGAVCLSVNKNVVHGVPTKYILQPGDVVTLDLGATYKGAIADAAFTAIYGEAKDPKHQEMLKLCQQGLNAGIDAFEEGKRIGAIGSAIYRTLRDHGYGIITDYGGHGINYDQPHAPPFVANKSHGNEGPRVQKGMSIAIEPMLIMGGSPRTRTLKDKWTIAGKDIGCHFEHSVTIDSKGNKHIITEHGMDAADYV